MGASRCRVSFTDTEGLGHEVEVEATSRYEAVALAMAQFRDDELLEDPPKPMTEFTLTLIKDPVQHKIRLQQLHRWASQAPVADLRLS